MSLRVVGLLAVGAIAFALVLSVSTAGVLRNVYPATALKWSPWDAGASANLAALVQSSDPSPAAQEAVRATAIAALRRDVTMVPALRVLGLAADAAGDQATALRFFTAAERTSRRDQATQAWLIMYHFNRGDPERTMRHFDTALRTTNRNLGTLLPLLVRMSMDRRMVPRIRRLLEPRPNWGFDFVSYLVRNGQPLEHVTFLTRGMLDADDPTQANLVRRLIARLVEADRLDLAWSVYQEHQPAARAANLRNGGFEAGGTFAPFDWELVDDIGLAAVPQARAGSGNALVLSASSGRSGQVARQLIRLPPRSYRMQLDAAAVPADPAQRPRISIQCAGASASTLLEVRLPRAGEAPVRVAARFAVPAGCRWQWLSVQAVDQGAGGAMEPWIDNVVIAPTG
ncbi:MAG: hypothetical protein AB7H79_06860 [Sphingomonas sp.]